MNSIFFDAKSLADKLVILSQNKELGDKFGERSYEKLVKGFTSKIMAEQTLAEYKKLVYG